MKLSVLVPSKLSEGVAAVTTVRDDGFIPGEMTVATCGKSMVLTFHFPDAGVSELERVRALPAKEYEFRKGQTVVMDPTLHLRLVKFASTFDVGGLAERIGCARSALNRLVASETPPRAKLSLLRAVDDALMEADVKMSRLV